MTWPLDLGLGATGCCCAVLGGEANCVFSAICLGAALTERFVKHDGACGRGVERTDSASHRDTQEMIAGAADEVVEAGALAAQDKYAVTGEIELVVVRLAAFVEADNPKPLALEV